MKFIKIIDCQNNEQNLNTSLIYNVNAFTNFSGEIITNIHLNHKDDNYTFSIFKTDEPVTSFLKRLEAHR